MSDPQYDEIQLLMSGSDFYRRGMVDMRKRFRGNQPIATSLELEGGAEEPSHQLYGGKPAGGSVVRPTSGDEAPDFDPSTSRGI